MANSAQRRAATGYRQRLAARGLTRYEPRGLEENKELIRKLANRLAGSGPEVARLQMELKSAIGEEPPSGRQPSEALRRSPLVGAELDLEREIVPICAALPDRYKYFSDCGMG
jgi:hypothetical protein